MEQSQTTLMRAFFEGRLSGAGLGNQIRNAAVFDSDVEIRATPDDPSEIFVVTSGHLVGLCDATLSGDLHPSQLETIASILISSERFVWNLGNASTDRVNEVIHCWDTPDINYPLTQDTVMKFRRFLETGEKTLDEHDREGGPLELIPRTDRNRRR